MNYIEAKVLKDSLEDAFDTKHANLAVEVVEIGAKSTERHGVLVVEWDRGRTSYVTVLIDAELDIQEFLRSMGYDK